MRRDRVWLPVDLFACAVLLMSAVPAPAQTLTASFSVGTGPSAVAVNPVTNKIYVVNRGSNTVTVIDGATNATTTVSVGTEPLAAAVNPITNKIYVANFFDFTVTVIDGATNATTTVSVGTGPGSEAVNPVTNKIYVTNQGSSTVTVIDGATNATTTVSVGPSGTGSDEFVPDQAGTTGIYKETFDASNDSAWGYIPYFATYSTTSTPYGLMLNDVGAPTPASTSIVYYGYDYNSPLGPNPCQPLAFDIEGDKLTVGTLVNGVGSGAVLYALILNNEQTATVTLRYFGF